MDSVLITITVLSLLATVIMATAAWHLFRDERRRIDARVASLAASLGEPEPNVPAMAFAAPQLRTAAAAPAPAMRGSSVEGSSLARAGADDETNPWSSSENEPARAASHAPGTDLFATTNVPEHDVSRRLMPAMAAGALFVTLALGSILILTSTGPVSTSAAAAPRTAAPLELVSLRHTVDTGQFTITGLVRNPSGAPSVTAVTAVAFFFAADGAFLGSERQRVDFATLAGGDESPFVIRTRVTPVARYRVSFRTIDDRPMPHIDRREKS